MLDQAVPAAHLSVITSKLHNLVHSSNRLIWDVDAQSGQHTEAVTLDQHGGAQAGVPDVLTCQLTWPDHLIETAVKQQANCKQQADSWTCSMSKHWHQYAAA